MYAQNNHVKAYYKAYKEYLIAKDNFPFVNFRYVVAPSVALPDASFPLLFKQSDLQASLAQGLTDAENCVKLGPV